MVAGGIYFGEFSELSSGALGKGTVCLFVGGLCLIMLGLYLIAPEVSTDEPADEEVLPAVPEEYALQESGRSSFSRALAVTGLPSASFYGTPRNSFDSATDSQVSYVTARNTSITSTESPVRLTRSRGASTVESPSRLGPRTRAGSSVESPTGSGGFLGLYRAGAQGTVDAPSRPDNTRRLLPVQDAPVQEDDSRCLVC